MLSFKDQLPARTSQLGLSPLSTNSTFLLQPPSPLPVAVLQFASLLYVSVMPAQCEAGRPVCPQTEKLLQLTITQQASVIFRLHYCVPMSAVKLLPGHSPMANLSLTPNMKLSPSLKRSSPPAALLTQSGVNLADASGRERTCLPLQRHVVI